MVQELLGVIAGSALLSVCLVALVASGWAARRRRPLSALATVTGRLAEAGSRGARRETPENKPGRWPGAGEARLMAGRRASGQTGRHDEVEASIRPLSDRRRVSRCPLIGEADCGTIKGRVTDLSQTGLFIDTLALLDVGTILELKLRLPGLRYVLYAHGEVAWIQPHLGIGIRFVNMDRTTRRELLEYLIDRFEKA